MTELSTKQIRNRLKVAAFKIAQLAAAMDEMPVKELIAHELIDGDGHCCTIGVVCKSRGLDVSNIDIEAPEQVGDLVGIARQLAAEIEYENDDWCGGMTPEELWNGHYLRTR